PKFMSGQLNAEITTLLSASADLTYSSFWGVDLSGLILQGVPRGLFEKSKVLLTAVEPALDSLGDRIPDGTIIGARGPFGPFAPDTELNEWFRKVYIERFDTKPNYEAYKMAQAILGVKS